MRRAAISRTALIGLLSLGTAGSLVAMASVPAASAAAGTPVLSDLARAIKTAGLTARFDSARPVTVFAPDDGAFTQLGSGNVTTLLSRKPDLVRVLRYLVVRARVDPADFTSGRVFTTLARYPVIVSRDRTVYKVNSADVLCGNIRTANGTLYILNRFPIPVLSRKAATSRASRHASGA